VNLLVDATRPAIVAVLCGTGAALQRLDAARGYRAGGGRGEKEGITRNCCVVLCSSTSGRRTLIAIAIKNHKVMRMAGGKAAVPGVNAARSTTARQKKTATRRT
jgi:hypothetical protein